jgi:hypothetical protein
MSKQTAVDWLEEQYYESEGKLTRHDFEQAKKMQREQIVNAVDGFPLYTRDLLGDDYYKELYGGQDEH